jgi:hypothetical protein
MAGERTNIHGFESRSSCKTTGKVGIDILQKHPGSWWLREFNDYITQVRERAHVLIVCKVQRLTNDKSGQQVNQTEPLGSPGRITEQFVQYVVERVQCPHSIWSVKRIRYRSIFGPFLFPAIYTFDV